MSSEFRLQLRGPGRPVKVKVASSMPLLAFQALVAEKTRVAENDQVLLCGFPPKEISMTNPASSIADLGVVNSDSIIVKTRSSQSRESKGIQRGGGWDMPRSLPTSGGIAGTSSGMVLKKMPRDNSCLFHCMAYLLGDRLDEELCKSEGKNQRRSSQDTSMRAYQCRQVIANIVRSDPKTFDTTFLGMPNYAYAQEVLHPDSWGGAIDLAIFAVFFRTEIVALDVKNLRLEAYTHRSGLGGGSQEEFKRRCYIVYHGDHYDALVYNGRGGKEQRLFQPSDKTALSQAKSVASGIHKTAASGGKVKLQSEWKGSLTEKLNWKQFGGRKVGFSDDFGDTKSRNSTGGASTSTTSRAPSGMMPERALGSTGGTTSSQRTARPRATPSLGKWACDSCTYENPSGFLSCEMCNATRKNFTPSTQQEDIIDLTNDTSSGPSSTSNQNSDVIMTQTTYFCKSCNFENQRTAARCEVCHTTNPVRTGGSRRSSVSDQDRAPLPTARPEALVGPLVRPDPMLAQFSNIIFGGGNATFPNNGAGGGRVNNTQNTNSNAQQGNASNTNNDSVVAVPGFGGFSGRPANLSDSNRSTNTSTNNSGSTVFSTEEKDRRTNSTTSNSTNSSNNNGNNNDGNNDSSGTTETRNKVSMYACPRCTVFTPITAPQCTVCNAPNPNFDYVPPPGSTFGATVMPMQSNPSNAPMLVNPPSTQSQNGGGQQPMLTNNNNCTNIPRQPMQQQQQQPMQQQPMQPGVSVHDPMLVRQQQRLWDQAQNPQLRPQRRGIFGEPDWQCSRCGRTNVHGLLQCVECNTPNHVLLAQAQQNGSQDGCSIM